MALDLKAMRDADAAQLQQRIADLQRHMFDLRTQAVTEKLEDPTQFRKARRDIARLKTLLRERELGQQK